MKPLCYLFLLLFSCSPNSTVEEKVPATFVAKVIGIKDGDTFQVLYEGKPITVRLEHIDCPEKGQPFGKNAKKFSSDFCFNKQVTIKNKGKYDRYKRLIAEIYFEGSCVNMELVKNGYAWHFKKYSDNVDYNNLEQVAKQNKTGLWADVNAIAPWEWRKK